MSEGKNGSLSVGERLERIEHSIDKVNERLRNVELRIVYISAFISAIVSFGAWILSYLVK